MLVTACTTPRSHTLGSLSVRGDRTNDNTYDSLVRDLMTSVFALCELLTPRDLGVGHAIRCSGDGRPDSYDICRLAGRSESTEKTHTMIALRITSVDEEDEDDIDSPC